MDLKVISVIFTTVFLAELGDKTQLATVLFASDRGNSVAGVFLAASAALIASTALAVVVGSQLAHYVNPKHLSVIAGAGFIAIGVWTLWTALRGS
jgi:putative Ca2+/H+ antiporter (TMEM165/GDT1 family)